MTIKISSAIKISSSNKGQTNIVNSTHILQGQPKLYMRKDSNKHTHHIRSNNVSRKIIYKT